MIASFAAVIFSLTDTLKFVVDIANPKREEAALRFRDVIRLIIRRCIRTG
jgi:hypothetical protein